eukprot:3858940-Ditylum_brightwellii.AAC.1
MKRTSPIIAGATYFSIVFAVAFLFGAIRVSLLVPRVGELMAVLIEIPIILIVSWKTMKATVRNQRISKDVRDRGIMGLVAFSLLMVAELTLSVVVFGKKASDFLEDVTSLAPQFIGLYGQVAYGLFPLLEERIDSPRRNLR